MSSEFNRLRLKQTEQAIEPFAALKGQPIPSSGWLKAIRESLGRSLRGQAQRIGITAPTLLKSEAAELTGGITLSQLRKLAQGLDCELVYGLVPQQPLSKMVETQAEQMARREILGVAHSMSLEDQRPSDKFLDQQIAERRQSLLEGSWTKLWR